MELTKLDILAVLASGFLVAGCNLGAGLLPGNKPTPKPPPKPVSPGANRIAYLSQDGSFWLVSPDLKDRRLLFYDPNLAGKTDFHFGWAPDASKIIMDGLRLIDLATGEIKNYPEGKIPKWSPTGDRILFADTVFGSQDLYLIKADGTNIKLVDKNVVLDLGVNHSRNWAPKGEKFVYTKVIEDTETGETKNEIWIADADGENKRQLFDPGKFGILDTHFPSWAPNKEEIVFAFRSLVKLAPSRPSWPEPNLAQRADIRAQSSYGGALPSLAIDDNTNTSWVCGSPRCWFRLTFPDRILFDRLIILPTLAPPSTISMEIFTGDNPSALTKIDGFTGPSQEGSRIEFLFNRPINARIIEIRGNFNKSWMGLTEIGLGTTLSTGGEIGREVFNLALAKADGSNITVLAGFSDPAASVEFPSWTPDGLSVAWVNEIPGSLGGVWIFDLAPFKARKMFQNEMPVMVVPTNLSWAPNSKLLAVRLQGTGPDTKIPQPPGIFLINRDPRYGIQFLVDSAISFGWSPI